jgi:hypothetical protein
MAGRSDNTFETVQSLAFALLLVLLLGGCVSKSQADAQARMAYLAGQRDALMQLQQQSHHGPSVTFIGPVNNHVITWSEGLTLSQGIVKAVYSVPTDPVSIVIHRNGQDVQANPNQLLAGQDLPLQPGDVVEIH